MIAAIATFVQIVLPSSDVNVSAALIASPCATQSYVGSTTSGSTTAFVIAKSAYSLGVAAPVVSLIETRPIFTLEIATLYVAFTSPVIL